AQHRCLTVHGVLAGSPAARPRTRGEHHGVGVHHFLGQFGDCGFLQVDDHGFGTHGLDVLSVFGVTDEGDGSVATFGQLRGQTQCDLPVSPGDDDTHGGSVLRCVPAV